MTNTLLTPNQKPPPFLLKPNFCEAMVYAARYVAVLRLDFGYSKRHSQSALNLSEIAFRGVKRLEVSMSYSVRGKVTSHGHGSWRRTSVRRRLYH